MPIARFARSAETTEFSTEVEPESVLPAQPENAEIENGQASETRDSETGEVMTHLRWSALAAGLATIGVVWPGGVWALSLLADQLFTFTVFGALFFAVTRHPDVKELLATVPTAAKRAGKILVAAMLIGQLWGASAQTYPLTTWTMYSQNPGDTAVVYNFTALTADGDRVAFAPSASNRTLPAKMALVHLRWLSADVYNAALDSDRDAVVVAEDALSRAVVAYVGLDDFATDPELVGVEVSRVSYDITQERVPVDSGERSVLLEIELDAS